MALEYIAPSCFGRTPSGCLLLQTTLRGVVWVERRPVQFRTIAGIHRPAPGELARRPRSRVLQPLNTADRPTSHNGTIMQRGPLLQPFCSTERVLSGPPRAHPSGCCSAVPSSQGSARTGSRPRTATGFDGLNVFTCPAPPKKQTHPLGGFSSRRLLRKSLTPFPGGSPPKGPLPPSANTPHPFSPKLSRFVCWRHKPRQPRVSANLCCGVFHSRAEPDENPSSNTRKGFLWAQLFRSPATAFPRRRAPFDVGFGTSAAVASSPFRLPCRGRGRLGIRISPYGDSAPRRYSVPLYRLGAAKFPSFGTFSSNLWNFVRNFSNPWNMGPPAARAPPHKMGPRALRALLFPDICREIETP